MGEIAIITALCAVAWTAWAGIWTCLLKHGVSAERLFTYSIFMLISSVVVFGLASFASETAYQATLAYATSVLVKGLHGESLTNANVADIQAAAQWATYHGDNLHIAGLVLVNAGAAVLKYFVPAILAGLGVWSLGKFMD
jgi:hypothetical protein